MLAALQVRLKGADPTAITAFETLRHEMGYGSTIQALSRSDSWTFEIGGAGRGREVLEKIVTESNLFVNPNKHLYRIESEGDRPKKSGPFSAWIAVPDPSRGALARERLERRYGLAEVRRVAYAMVWRLDFQEGTSDPGALAEEIAVLRSRDRGLLVNPHAAEGFVFAHEPTVLELARLGDHPPLEGGDE